MSRGEFDGITDGDGGDGDGGGRGEGGGDNDDDNDDRYFTLSREGEFDAVILHVVQRCLYVGTLRSDTRYL